MAGPLDGVRVLDLSWGIAGPLGVLLLAEHGADVVKVEPPGGDPFRAYDGARVWNRSRRSLTVDLKSDEGRDVMRRLLASADVVVPIPRSASSRLMASYSSRFTLRTASMQESTSVMDAADLFKPCTVSVLATSPLA